MTVTTVPVPKFSNDIPVYVASGSRTVFLPGHWSGTPEGELLHPEDLAGQTRQVLRHIATSLKEVDGDFSDLVKLDVFTTTPVPEHIGIWFEAAAEVAGELGVKEPPMPSIFQVVGLGVPGMLLEVTGIAVLS